MKKTKTRRLLAGTVGAVMLATCAASFGALPAAAEDANYGKALALSLYMFDSNACGKGIKDGPLTWRADCHTYDDSAAVGSLDGGLKSIVDPDGDGKVDVEGGYHDAGDHIKFNLTIGFGMNSLVMSEYLNPGVYKKAGCYDHLVYILRRGCDYLMKTTFLNDSGEVAAIAHVVAEGGTDHAYWSAPEVQTYERPAFWLTASSNNSAVCGEMSAALGGMAWLMKDSDPAYSAKCLKYAKALEAFGKKNVGNETGGLGGFYSTSAMYQDEIAMADAWLFINGEGEMPSYQPNNGDYGGIGDWDKYQWDKVWQGFSALMYKATGDQVYFNELKYEHEKNGLSSSSYKKDAGWGNSRYNCALQMTALSLAGDDKDSEYAKAAKYQMDYILGGNGSKYCYLIGYQSPWPTKIHHRAANPGDGTQTADSNMDAKYTNYGLLVGGENGSGYADQTNKYEYTEGALDYNGCFALACAGLYRLYGGDASAVKEIESSASEINDSFVFGNNDAVTTTTTTVTTTTTTVTTTTTTVTTTTSTVSTTSTTPTDTTKPIGKYRAGDINEDGVVDVKDAVMMARVVGGDTTAANEVSDQGMLNANIDGNAGLQPGDLTKLLRVLARLESL